MVRGGGKGCLRVHHYEAVSTRISCARSLTRSLGDVCADGQRSRGASREVVADPSAKRAAFVFRKDRFRCVRHGEDFEASIQRAYVNRVAF